MAISDTWVGSEHQIIMWFGPSKLDQATLKIDRHISLLYFNNKHKAAQLTCVSLLP